MFGEDFLIKLGFDVKNSELRKTIRELEKLKKIAKSTKVTQEQVDKTRNKAATEALKKERQSITLMRKRAQLEKKMMAARRLGMNVDKKQFLSPNRYSKTTTLDKKIIELDLAMAKYAEQEGKKAQLAKEKLQEKRSYEARMEALRKKRERVERARLADEKRRQRQWNKVTNDFAHTFGTLAGVFGIVAGIATSQVTQMGIERATTQMDIAFGDESKQMIDSFVNSLKDLGDVGKGIGRLQATEAISQVAPALAGGPNAQFTREEATGVSQELLLISKFSGQLSHMEAVARNFAQISTSLEGEDVNQFADRFTGLMPFIYNNLKEAGKISEANRASFLKAKDAGQVVSADFINAFRKAVQRISNDEKLIARLSRNLYNAWDKLVAGIENAQLNFMGQLSGEGIEAERTSLSEALFVAYNELTDALQRSRHSIRNFGEVIGKIILFLTKVFLQLQLNYYKFLRLVRDITGLEEDTLDKIAAWIALTPIIIGIVAIFAKIFKATKNLFKFFGGKRGLTTSATEAARQAKPTSTAGKAAGMAKSGAKALGKGGLLGATFGFVLDPIVSAIAMSITDLFRDEQGRTLAEQYEDPKFTATMQKHNEYGFFDFINDIFGGEEEAQKVKETIKQAPALDNEGYDAWEKEEGINYQPEYSKEAVEAYKRGDTDFTGNPMAYPSRTSNVGGGSSTDVGGIVNNNNIVIHESGNPQSTASQVGFAIKKSTKEGANEIAMNN